MRKRASVISVQRISEINMTPLMDLTFILLITFIITFPLIEHGIELKLPQHEATEFQAEKGQTISVDKSGMIYLNDSEITLAKLAKTMNDLGRTQPDVTIFIRADKNIYYGKVVEVLKSLHDANISRMALVTSAE